MYSSIDGAKKFAKTLKSLLDGSGIVFPLHRSQAATAQAGGYRDWDDLRRALKESDRPVDPESFPRHLVTALPKPCWVPVLSWLEDGRLPKAREDGLTEHYYRAVVPYVLASSVIHRSTSPLLRPGSGPGQRLRESMVVSLLLGGRGRITVSPRLEPDTLALVVEGDIAGLFGPDADHPRFRQEFESLVGAAIFDYRDGILRVLPADKEKVAAHVADGLAGRAEYFSGVGPDEAAEAVATALSAEGIEHATRLADAIVGREAAAHITPSGPMLDALSKLAEQGQLKVMSRAWRLFSIVHPDNAGFVRQSVPAKISSMYWSRLRRLDAARVVQWMSSEKDWAERLKDSLQDPSSFETTVDAMTDAIQAAR